MYTYSEKLVKSIIIEEISPAAFIFVMKRGVDHNTFLLTRKAI